MTCGLCFHGRYLCGDRESVSRGVGSSKVFITQQQQRGHTGLHSGEEDQFRSLPDYWLSLCIFSFHLSVYFPLSGDVGPSMCSSPAVTVQVCTDGRQEGQIVYCFRPCGMPAVMDGLGRGFSSGRSVSPFL